MSQTCMGMCFVSVSAEFGSMYSGSYLTMLSVCFFDSIIGDIKDERDLIIRVVQWFELLPGLWVRIHLGTFPCLYMGCHPVFRFPPTVKKYVQL